MNNSGERSRISTSAKVIFAFIPVAILILFELIASLIVPADITKDEALRDSVDLHRSAIPPIYAGDSAMPYDRAKFVQNTSAMFTKALPNQPIHDMDDTLFYRPKRNFSFTFIPHTGTIINYSTNSLGFRGEEFQAKKPEGKTRIICTGDSSTFGCFVNIIDTYSEKLKNILLRGTVEKNAEVINAGVVGYSSYQGLKYFETTLRDLEPDILVASWGYNDVRKAPVADSDVRASTVKSLKVSSKLNKIALYRLIDRIIGRTKEKTGLSASPVPKVSPEEYRQNLDKLIDYCRKDGIHLVFLPITAPLPYFEIMKDLAKRNNGVGFINMEAIFTTHYDRFVKEKSTKYKRIRMAEIYKREFDEAQLEKYGSPEMGRIREWSYLFMDHCHPTPVGYYIIAESLFDYVTNEGFFTKIKVDFLAPPKIGALTINPPVKPNISE